MPSTQIISGAFTPFLVMPDTGGCTKKFVLRTVGIVDKISLKIFTKWGTTIFESDNYNNNWDGTNTPAGTYYYEVSVSSPALMVNRAHRGWIKVVR